MTRAMQRETVAAALLCRLQTERAETAEQARAARAFAQGFADGFHSRDPRFDRYKFMQAAGILGQTEGKG